MTLSRYYCVHSITPCFKRLVGTITQGITFEKARRATNRSLKMTIWSRGSDLCYEEKISARARHFITVCQGGAILTQP